jgi:hypothetical protein
MTAYELRLSRYEPGALQSPTSTWTSISDVGRVFDDGQLSEGEYMRVEGLYLGALESLLDDAGRPDLTVSDLQLTPAATVRARAVQEGQRVGMRDALEICRLGLREEISCRLDDDQRFYIHVGFDYYVYVGCERLSPDVIAQIEDSGLFLERGVPSPYATT